MQKKWVLKPYNEHMPALPEYPALICRLLSIRGLTQQEDIQNFLNPEYGKLFDPFLFKDMKKVCQRIRQALDSQEKIVIYADYDADAITASAVMTLALRKLGGIVDSYIPDRFTEGYGMNLDAIKNLKAQGTGLLITVDCGTNSVKEAELCKELGLDLIVTDHHEITGNLPDAYALVNPKNPTDNYLFKYLTGVGVAFKVVQALFSDEELLKQKGVVAGWEKWLLDIVSIGTVADLQTLESENRILVSYGLQVLAKSRWPGVKALLEVSKLKPGKFTTYTLGFVLAPRINAAGRIKHADVAYKLLVSENIIEAQNYALELDTLNGRRQLLTEQILSEAREQASLLGQRKVLLVSGSNWPKGVVGLVAGKLAEEFGRPVLVLEKGEQFSTGSARSHPKFDMVKALTHCSDLLEKYGGHTQAAGFTLTSTNVDLLYKKLLEFADTLGEADTEPILEIDAELKANELNWDVYKHIEKFEPFGFGNPKPKFLGKMMEVVESRTVGAESQHLKLKLLWDGHVIDGIGFRQGYLVSKFMTGAKIDVVFEIEANEWNGTKTLQLKIIDIKPGNPDAFSNSL